MSTTTPPKAGKTEKRDWVALAHKVAYAVTALWVLVIALLATPWFQRHALYQHAVKIPWGAKFDLPEKYGFAPGKVLNTYLHTPDNLTLGSWFLLSEPFHQARRSSSGSRSQPSIEEVQAAMQQYPTILYLHGQAGTRAAPTRCLIYSSLTARLHTNIFAIDYRGFGESQGQPSTEGLADDAHTAWRWLIDNGAKPEDILIVGHSLGTGVASHFAARLAKQGEKPRGLALLAPFSSLTTLIETYDIEGLPLLQPLQTFAFGRKLLRMLMYHEYDTLSIIQDINIPVFLAHSMDDMDVPYHHSQTLLDHLLDPHLPPRSIMLPSAPGAALGAEDFAKYVAEHKQRLAVRSELVRKVEVDNFGTIEEFDGAAGKVVYVEAFWGAHQKVALQEGVQDVMASMFRLGKHL